MKAKQDTVRAKLIERANLFCYSSTPAAVAYRYDFSHSAYRMKDIIFDIILSGVTSITGIAMELNRRGCYGREWKLIDVKRLLDQK